MKSPWRWSIRIALLLILGGIAATFFRYEYTNDKSVRVDRLTGQSEVFCEAQQQWTSLQTCYGAQAPKSSTP